MKIIADIEDLNKYLLSNGFIKTSSIVNPKKDSVVFIRDKKYIDYIYMIKKNVFIILDEYLLKRINGSNNYAMVYPTKYPEYEFALFPPKPLNEKPHHSKTLSVEYDSN